MNYMYIGFYEKDKDRLVNIMAYGEDLPPPDLGKAIAKHIEVDIPSVDRFDECKHIVEYSYRPIKSD